MPESSSPVLTPAEEFLALTQTFDRRARELNLGDTSRFYWYHTIDLGDGLITPGLYDYRKTVSDFHFPQDMSGMTVLDVGSATGFFAFEFARRGADVVSVELPSLDHLDRFPGQNTDALLWKIERMIAPSDDPNLDTFKRRYTAEELWFYLLEGPFRFCQRRLGLKVDRCFSSVYDLTAAKTGRDGFDLVFLGDILVHTLYPLKALAAAAALSKNHLMLAQVMPGSPKDAPAMHYVGGDDVNEDEVSWFWPNQACFTQLLRKLGFPQVREVGHHTGTLRPGGTTFDRVILHASRL